MSLKIQDIYKTNDCKNTPIRVHTHEDGDPEISVVIPVHNAEKYLRECLESILSQKLSVLMEIITVLDASEDASGEILSEYADAGEVVLLHSPQSGPSAARNTGIAHARGKYLVFIDADDYLTYSEYLQELYEKITETGADIVQSGYIKTDGESILSTFMPEDEEVEGYAKMRHSIPGFSWGKIMKAELFDGICYPVDYWFEDSIFHMIILRQCQKAAFLKKAGYAYRKNIYGITYSKDRTKRSVEAVTVISKVLDMLENVDEETTHTVLEHAGVLLENRIRKLSLTEQKACFLYLADVMDTLPRVDDALYDIYKKRQFFKWKLLCLKGRFVNYS